MLTQSAPTLGATYAHFAVAADHPAASRVGADILRAGGNAADAAIATALALGVTRPDSSGLGGGGFLVYFDARTHRVSAIDFREKAPAAASRDMYVRDGHVVPGLSLDGGLAVAVPGEVAGLALASRLHGRLPWARLFDGAIALAEEGVALTPAFRELLDEQAEMLRAWPLIALRYIEPGGLPPPTGSIVRHKGLGATLRLLAAHGAEAFYTGDLAREIAAAARRAGGVLTEEDLAAYAPVEREPIHGTFGPYDLYAMPPPSSGGVALVEILNVLAARPEWPGLATAPAGHPAVPGGPADVAWHHLVIEAMKQAFADRAMRMGDPDFSPVPASFLTSKSYARLLATRITPGRTQRPEHCGGLAAPDDHGTTHLCVIDADGNAAAMTLTVNTEFGSKVVVPGRGIVLNNEMDDFTSAPGVPNTFGLVQSEANAIAPGKRPLSSMTPTIVVKDGRVALVVGGSGGPRIISGTLEVLLNILQKGMDAPSAVDAPRFHHQWQPDSLALETSAPGTLALGLAALGHTIVRGPAECAVQAIAVSARGLSAASDKRKGGKPDGE